MSKPSLPCEPHPHRTKNWPENSAIDDLRDSLLSQGLLYPIKCCIENGRRLITDGWMRYLLCVENQIPIRYDIHQPEDALDVIVGTNFARHHWTKSQIAMFIAGKAASMDGWSLQKKIDTVRETYGIARTKAIFNEDQLVRTASKIRAVDPALADDVMAGKITVSAAAEELKNRQKDKSDPNIFLKTIHQGVCDLQRNTRKTDEIITELTSSELRDTKDSRTIGVMVAVMTDRTRHDKILKKSFPEAARAMAGDRTKRIA
jgi:hypothetical protein